MRTAQFSDKVAATDGTFASGWRMWLSTISKIIGSVQYAGIAQYEVPLTGFTIQALSNASKVIINPAGVLAAGTVTMPATPFDGMEWRLSSTQVITALTLLPSTGQTVKNAPTALAAGAGVGYTYATTGATWYRLY